MDPLGLAKVFVKTAVRMFYETEHIVVTDALVFHGALSLADIALVLDYGKQLKTAQKLCGRLKEGGLVSVFARAEVRDGALKAVTREYYYIDYRRAIDATKYRLHMLDERIKEDAKPTTEKKEYNCQQCKAEWTSLDVLDFVDMLGRRSGFLCPRCDHPLDALHEDGNEPENDDTPAKFNKQFGPLLKLMQQIDQVTIPAIEGEDAVQNAIELPRDKDINPAARHEPVPNPTVRPTAVKGTNTAPEKIEVQIATEKEYSEAARDAEKERLAKIAAQNALPEWVTHSTVTNQAYATGVSASTSAPNGASAAIAEAEPEEEDTKTKDPTLDAYFAALEEEQKRQAEEEEEEEDDDDDEFEDVVGAVPTNGMPDAKRLKLDSPAISSPAKGATPVSMVAPSPAGNQEESDEDDEEFESVV